ncbi:unnamed protein product [Owenia fusiformis]|uniref:Nucleotide-diphospho-sugar transferase domain-containing protein n=1 Tax=Owenia fusiformis TaxID=6347 RepID=A0A8S4P7U9_OWEFU|nr:unnamed protein product [Owenia fusiformis]
MNGSLYQTASMILTISTMEIRFNKPVIGKICAIIAFCILVSWVLSDANVYTSSRLPHEERKALFFKTLLNLSEAEEADLLDEHQYFAYEPECETDIRKLDINMPMVARGSTRAVGAKLTSLITVLPNDLVKVANKKFRKTEVIYTALVTEETLLFAKSWLCNTKYLGIHPSVLLFSPMLSVIEILKKEWPGVNALFIPISQADELKEKHGFFHTKLKGLSMMVVKLYVISTLIQNNFHTVLFETDSYWKKNPLSHLRGYSKSDVIFSSASHLSDHLSRGLLYFKPIGQVHSALSNTTKYVHAAMRRLVSSNTTDECTVYTFQAFLQWNIIDSGKVKYKLLPYSIVADGMWYVYHSKESNRRYVKQSPHDPIIILNNGVRKTRLKIFRAEKHKHWFLRDDTISCKWQR